MNALEEFRAMIEEHWPHSDPYWREGEVQFAPTIGAIADRIEAEYMPYPLDADGVPVKPGDSMESGGAKFVAETFVWRQPKKGIASFGCGHCLIGDGGYKADHCHHVEQPKLTKEDID